ncbi:hypothetical protein D3C80_1448730 [compost metagenome]
MARVRPSRPSLVLLHLMSLRDTAASTRRFSVTLTLPSSSTPLERTEPLWTLKPGLTRSVVSMLSWSIWYADNWMKPSMVVGSYLTPTSYCLPVLGSNGLALTLVPDCGRNDSE